MDMFKHVITQHHIETLIDIRNATILANDLVFGESPMRKMSEAMKLSYHWAGRQFSNQYSPTHDGPDSSLNMQLRGFANYMRSDQFAKAYRHLLNLATKSCSLIVDQSPTLESSTRRLIADYLTIHGHHAIHILDGQRQQEHALSPELRRESAQLIYDRVY